MSLYVVKFNRFLYFASTPERVLSEHELKKLRAYKKKE
jgi:hypothetical protein